jgi:hypothetical protein
VRDTSCEEGLIKDSTIECKVGDCVLTSYCGYHVATMYCACIKSLCLSYFCIIGIECFLGKIVSFELAYKFLSTKLV